MLLLRFFLSVYDKNTSLHYTVYLYICAFFTVDLGIVFFIASWNNREEDCHYRYGNMK